MQEDTGYYTSPSSMEPLFPQDDSGKLEGLAIRLIEEAARLSAMLHPITRTAIAEYLRPMNSYYSNLIEGHDTHPIDIQRALKNDFSANQRNADLQQEAQAHIVLHRSISQKFEQGGHPVSPYAARFLKEIHQQFYGNLPVSFREIPTETGTPKEVLPGEFRNDEVKVGRHIAPLSSSLNQFMERFETFYDPSSPAHKSKSKRVVALAAAHHRLAWIHPFLDGNGRVVRLFSDACFMYENLHASGLWSISRGLARANQAYKAHLANADQQRYNDYDGRGNLSNRFLVEFCQFFLETAIDQVEFMAQMLDIENMLKRIGHFSEVMVGRGRLEKSAKFILTDVFLKGRISKTDAMRITNTSDKTLTKNIRQLESLELLRSQKEGKQMWYYVNYPINYSPFIFPSIYPSDKEGDMAQS